jgi:hypothetical protein
MIVRKVDVAIATSSTDDSGVDLVSVAHMLRVRVGVSFKKVHIFLW